MLTSYLEIILAQVEKIKAAPMLSKPAEAEKALEMVAVLVVDLETRLARLERALQELEFSRTI